MLPISAAALAALPQAIRRPARAEWSNDGGATWTPAAVASASVKADRTAEVRYTASATLVDVPLGRSGINTIATRVRLFQGVMPTRTEVEWIPAGVYVVDRVSGTLTGASLELSGLEAVIKTAPFVATRVVGPDSARALVEQLVGEVLPGTPVAWRSGVDPDRAVPQVTADSDRWGTLTSSSGSSSAGIVQALAGEIWADPRGVVTVGPVPTLDSAPVWRVAQGAGGVLVEAAPVQSSDGLYNVVAVTGDSGAGQSVIGPAYAWDSDPGSLTYAGPDPVNDPLAPQRLGLTWVRPRVLRTSSSVVTTYAQAQDMAYAQLADSLGVQASLSFTAVCNSALEPGDVVAVEVDPGRWEPHILDSLAWDLGGVSMQCSTRTTSRRL